MFEGVPDQVFPVVRPILEESSWARHMPAFHNQEVYWVFGEQIWLASPGFVIVFGRRGDIRTG
jgi:hypothetical protein